MTDIKIKTNALTVLHDVRVNSRNAAELSEWLGDTPVTYWRKVTEYQDGDDVSTCTELLIIAENGDEFLYAVFRHLKEIERDNYFNSFVDCAIDEIDRDEFLRAYCDQKLQALYFDRYITGTVCSCAMTSGNGTD